jgi:hypothetical protein
VAHDGERDVALEVALVELVEDDDPRLLEERIGEEPPSEDALGHEPESGAAAAPLLEAHPVADLGAERAAPLTRHERRGGAGRDPSGLEDDDGALAGEAGVEQHGRHSRRLAGSGGGAEHQPPPRAERGHDVWEEGVDRQARHGGAQPSTAGGPRSSGLTRGRNARSARAVRLAALGLVLATTLATAAPVDVGTALAGFTLDDQHGVPGTVDARTRIVLFTREMKGGDVAKAALAGADQSFLDARGLVYVADVSRMPAVVLRLFALPRMRERPYRMLLDRDGTQTRDLPATEGRATVLFLTELRVTRVADYGSAAELRAALESAPGR